MKIMFNRIFWSIWLISCLLSCAREIVKDQSLLIGDYKTFGDTRYRNLHMLSNREFRCDCNVSGKWISVNGTWDLLDDGSVNFSCMLNEKGARAYVELPVELGSDYIHILINENAEFMKER